MSDTPRNTADKRSGGASPRAVSWIYGIRTRLFLSLALLATLLLAALGIFIEAQARRELEGELTARLHAVGASAVTLLRPSLVPALLSFTPEQESFATYQDARRSLQGLREQTDVRRIFLADLQGRSFVDTDARVSIGSPLTQLRSDRFEIERVRAGEPAAAPLFTDQDGQIRKTGYVPVIQDNRTIAVVGVEADATFLRAVRALRNRIIAVFIGGILLALVFAAVVARGLTRPLDRLVGWSRRLEAGDLAHPVRLSGRDEIALLGRTLEQMRVALEARDRELRAMVGGVAHEIRNPLGGMRIYTELLARDTNLDETKRGRAEKILGELDRLAKIVEEFLLFARPASPQAADVEITTEIPEIIEWARPEAAGQSVEIAFDVVDERGRTQAYRADGSAGDGSPVEPPTEERTITVSVRCDPTHFGQVFRNLIRNAVEASPSGGVVSVHARVESGHVGFTVEDHGPGLDPETKERAFEPFFTTKPSGSGLGLAIVQRLVLLNQGTIGVGDAEDGGARFTVTLPKGRTG